MTSKYLVILLGCVVVLVWKSVVVAEECPEGDSNGNCSLTTQYNNELEPTTQEMVTHTAKPIETTNVIETTETTDITRLDESTTEELTTESSESVTNPPPISALAEDLTDNDIAPTPILSVIPLSSTEASSTLASVIETISKEQVETTSHASSTTVEPEVESETSPNILETSSSSILETSPSSTETSPNSLEIPLSSSETSTSSSETSTSSSNTSPSSSETSMNNLETSTSSSETSTNISTVIPELKEAVMTEVLSTISPVIGDAKTRTDAPPTIAVMTEESTEAKELSTTIVNITEGNEEMQTTTEEEHEQRTEMTMAATTLSAAVIEAKSMPEIITIGGSVDEPKGRALNFTVNEDGPNNVILSNFSSSSHHNDFDLSDVTINDDDNDDNFDLDMEKSKVLAPKYQIHNSTFGICEKGGLTYENGEKLEIGCDSICTCRNGKMDCAERCVHPFFRKGIKKTEDPLCSAKEAEEDQCCSVLVCTGDTETEPLEICSYENQTYNRGDHFNKGCSEVCTCEAAGKITCKPRCLPVTRTSDRCVELPDPIDSCCMKVLCDVTLDEHNSDKEYEKPKQKIVSAKYINNTAILLTFDSKFDDNESMPDVEVSNDRTNWTYYRLLPGGLVFVKDNVKYLKLENTDDIVEVKDLELGPFPSIEVNDDIFKDCEYKGKIFKIGEEYNDNCESLCICLNGHMKCLKIQCPTYFGVDVLDANCIEWETVPPNFVPTPPNCCPEKVRCKDNGSCDYEGRTYRNWDELPNNVTGCEKKCYCEMGKIECQNACPPVTALPPPSLPCPPHLAMLSNIHSDNTCCKEWVCTTETTSPENKHDQTESDIKGLTSKTTTDTYEVPFVPKAPSKTLGPLAVYANEDNDQNIVNNSLGFSYKPKLSDPYENPFFRNYPRPPNPIMNPVYYNPMREKVANKAFNGINNKFSKKNFSLYNTAPTPAEHNQNENYIPSENKPHAPFTTQPTPAHSEINIHTHSNPEELLQFIHQHPEISNYPSGSVLEFHNVPSSFHQNPAMPSVSPPKIQLVPYVVPQNSEGHHIMDNLPPGLSLEEILAEFHKNTHTFQNNPLSYHPQSQNAGSNGPPLVTRPNGPTIPNRLNTTHFTDSHNEMFPSNYPGFGHQPPQDEVVIQSLDAVDPHTVRLSFTVPPIIVGLHGRVEVRYTHDKADDDIDSWLLTVFAPPNDLIATPSLAFDLMDLNADTEYKIKVIVTLRDLQNMPTSKIYKITTPKEVHVPVIPINPDLAITDINATWVTVVWRQFTQYELSFIDGLQLRYKEIDGRIYTATPLIHRAETTYTLEKLKPNTKYEIGIYFIPFSGQVTELRSENILHFTTANEIDTYGFNVTLNISQIKSQSVEISWNGVPYPEDKYANVYRVIYQSDSGKEDQSTFKIAKRDSPTKTIIKELKPGTRYRIWLEVYLTNGKIKTSNVEDFITKPRVAPAIGTTTQQDKLARAEVIESKGDYYGPLVIVAILAAIAILSTLILLLILVRRHNQNEASITSPSTRISQSAYDNPTYKVEIQQETMGL